MLRVRDMLKGRERERFLRERFQRLGTFYRSRATSAAGAGALRQDEKVEEGLYEPTAWEDEAFPNDRGAASCASSSRALQRAKHQAD